MFLIKEILDNFTLPSCYGSYYLLHGVSSIFCDVRLCRLFEVSGRMKLHCNKYGTYYGILSSLLVEMETIISRHISDLGTNKNFVIGSDGVQNRE
jgi:hypothetical protein